MRTRHLLFIVALVCASTVLAASTPFEFTLDREAATSAGVYTTDGRLIRVLWSQKKLPSGRQADNWDGLDDFGRNVTPGNYELRIAFSNAAYTSIGTIGNSGVGEPMQAGTDDLIVDRAAGEIYTANNWEEAGQDFRKMDAAGRHLMDAKFGIRNGNPNGWPNAVAVEGGILYCACFTANDPRPDTPPGKRLAGGYVIRKFNATDGKPLKFPTETGYIRVRLPDPADEDPMNRQTIRSIVICGDAIALADKWKNRIFKYDKNTGKSLGEFELAAPACSAVDSQQRLWIAYDTAKIGVFDSSGKPLGEVPAKAAEIPTIRLVGDQLWVADAQAGITVYKTAGPGKAEVVKRFGHKARPGEFDPLAIGRIKSFDVMPDGGFVMAQTYGSGSVVTRFTADAKVIWQQVGLEFCTNCTYDPAEPDLFISSVSNAYRALDHSTGQWRFEGTLFDSSPFPRKARLASQSSGTPRILRLNGQRYYFSLHGDQIKVFRMENGMKLATWAGNGERAWNADILGPLPPRERNKGLQFCWNDTNGDSKVQPAELTVTREKGAGGFSCEVDPAGNILLPNHADSAVWKLPLDGFDAAGNPRYDWTKLQPILPADNTIRHLRPMKTIPIPGGYLILAAGDPSLYNAKLFRNGWNYCWMGGGSLSRYTLDGTRLWTIHLPGWCTGADWVPNADRTEMVGIIAGEFTAKDLFHYSPDGLLLGEMHPIHKTGWLDHNGSVSVCRNPRDGIADIFAEESFCNRISWYRMDDKAIGTLKVTVAKRQTPGETYGTEKEFYALFDAGRQAIKDRKYSDAAALLAKAMEQAAPAERPFVQHALGETLLNLPDRAAEGIGHLKAVAALETYDPQKRAEMIFRMNQAYRRLKDFKSALAVLDPVTRLPGAKERAYIPRAMLETARTRLDAGDLAAARLQAEKLKTYFKDRPKDDQIGYSWEASVVIAETFKREKDLDRAVDELESTRQITRFDSDRQMSREFQIGQFQEQKKDYPRAIARYESVLKDFPKATASNKADALLRIGDVHVAAGDPASARKSFQAIIDLPDAPDRYVESARSRLTAMDKKPPAGR